MVLGKLDTLIPHAKVKSKVNQKKSIKGLNLRDKTIKLLEENIGENRPDFKSDDNFLHMTSKAQAAKEKINWISSKFKSLYIEGHNWE